MERRDPQQPFGLHKHDFSELVIVNLETNFAESVSLDELTGIAGMPKRSFQRTFQLATGSTPIDYLIQVRINRAARSLCDSRESVTNIAFDVGFSDSNYFSRQFRKLMGVSPRDYRRRNG